MEYFINKNPLLDKDIYIPAKSTINNYEKVLYTVSIYYLENEGIFSTYLMYYNRKYIY